MILRTSVIPHDYNPNPIRTKPAKEKRPTQSTVHTLSLFEEHDGCEATSTASQRYLVVVSPMKTPQSAPDAQALHLRRSAPAIRAAATLLSSTVDQHRTLAHR
jgi:hypothetical protein